MDANSETTSQELSYQEILDQNNNGLGINDSNRPPGCGLCGRSFSLEDEVNGSHQNNSICNDCKFLLIEDFGSPARNSNRRRLPGRSRPIHGSADFTENQFSHQFSQIINLARRAEPGHDGFFDDGDSNSMLLRPSSSYTTPNGSTRWRRIISENGSDVSNTDSYYGESESNISYGAYYAGDSDAFSYSTYDGDSDTSVGGRTLFNTDAVQSVDRSDFDTDSDIDPMHAGNVRWDFEDHEEVFDAEWEEVDNEENVVEPLQVISHINTGGDSGSFLRRRRTDSSPESLGTIRWRVSEVEIHAPYIGDPGDYLDAQGFEEFLERIAEADSSRRGAPPALKSFVDNLPLILISEEHQKPDGLTCAICKDFLTIGTKVNQLPCLHLYHPTCILPWLSARNTCPLCRYELPAGEIEYEPIRSIASRMMITEIQRQDDSSSFTSDSSEMDENEGELEDVGSVADISSSSRGRGGWLLFAAAPIVSLMGIVFVLWLGNPLAGGQGQNGRFNLNCRPSDLIQTSAACPRNERCRRWWWF